MGVYDHTNNILGIRALDVKPKELMDLTEGYKLIVFEYATKKELTEQMEKVARLFPEPGKIKGLVMGGHGNMKSIISGDQEKDESINVDDISEIFQPHVNLFNKDAIVFLAACYSGLEEGKEKNMANAFAEALLERRVYSCNEQLIDFNYELDENNQVDPDSINLYTFGPTGWPFSNCTYVAFSEVGPKKWSKEEQFYYKYGKEGKRKLKFLEEGGIPSKLIVDNSLDPRSMNYTCKCIDYGWSNATGLSIEDTAAALSMSVEELLSRKVAIVCSSEEILYQGSQLQKQGNEQVLLEGRCMLVVNK